MLALIDCLYGDEAGGSLMGTQRSRKWTLSMGVFNKPSTLKYRLLY